MSLFDTVNGVLPSRPTWILSFRLETRGCSSAEASCRCLTVTGSLGLLPVPTLPFKVGFLLDYYKLKVSVCQEKGGYFTINTPDCIALRCLHTVLDSSPIKISLSFSPLIPMPLRLEESKHFEILAGF